MNKNNNSGIRYMKYFDFDNLVDFEELNMILDGTSSLLTPMPEINIVDIVNQFDIDTRLVSCAD